MDSSLRVPWFCRCCFWPEGASGKSEEVPADCEEVNSGDWQRGQALTPQKGRQLLCGLLTCKAEVTFCKGGSLSELSCVVKAKALQSHTPSTYCVSGQCSPQGDSSDRTDEVLAHEQPLG